MVKICDISAKVLLYQCAFSSYCVMVSRNDYNYPPSDNTAVLKLFMYSIVFKLYQQIP